MGGGLYSGTLLSTNASRSIPLSSFHSCFRCFDCPRCRQVLTYISSPSNPASAEKVELQSREESPTQPTTKIERPTVPEKKTKDAQLKSPLSTARRPATPRVRSPSSSRSPAGQSPLPVSKSPSPVGRSPSPVGKSPHGRPLQRPANKPRPNATPPNTKVVAKKSDLQETATQLNTEATGASEER